MAYEIDGCRYKTKTLRDMHIQWKEYVEAGLIESFELPQVKDRKRTGRYFSYKPVVNDIKFDSLMEAQYYIYLLYRLRKNEIASFDRQVKYELQPGFRNARGKKILPINYVADFVIVNLDKTTRVIDIKGRTTVDFNLKKKMFEYKFEKTLECIQLHDGKWMDLEDIKKLKRKSKKK